MSLPSLYFFYCVFPLIPCLLRSFVSLPLTYSIPPIFLPLNIPLLPAFVMVSSILSPLSLFYLLSIPLFACFFSRPSPSCFLPPPPPSIFSKNPFKLLFFLLTTSLPLPSLIPLPLPPHFCKPSFLHFLLHINLLLPSFLSLPSLSSIIIGYQSCINFFSSYWTSVTSVCDTFMLQIAIHRRGAPLPPGNLPIPKI